MFKVDLGFHNDVKVKLGRLGSQNACAVGAWRNWQVQSATRPLPGSMRLAFAIGEAVSLRLLPDPSSHRE